MPFTSIRTCPETPSISLPKAVIPYCSRRVTLRPARRWRPRLKSPTTPSILTGVRPISVITCRKRDIPEGGGTVGQLNELTWDGRNNNGDMVYNGVYIAIIKILATGEEARMKVAVMK